MQEINWSIEKRKLAQLTEWTKNPRRLTEKGLKDLKKSISKFGLAEPLVVNRDNTICGGHGRKKILEELNIKEVDCYLPDRMLNEKEFEELNLRLNKNVCGEFNFEILANEFDMDMLKDVGFEDIDFGMFPESDNDQEPTEMLEIVNFIVECENQSERDELKRLLETKNDKISFKELLLKIRR